MTKFITYYSHNSTPNKESALIKDALACITRDDFVVILDMDLEGSIIKSMPPFCKYDSNEGIFDLFLYHKQHDVCPSIRDYYSAMYAINFFLIPTVKDINTKKKFIDFNWDKNYVGENGRDFWLRLRDMLEYDFNTPDYIFINSESGKTPLASISTLLLPDKIIYFKCDKKIDDHLITSINNHSIYREAVKYLKQIEIEFR